MAVAPPPCFPSRCNATTAPGAAGSPAGFHLACASSVGFHAAPAGDEWAGGLDGEQMAALRVLFLDGHSGPMNDMLSLLRQLGVQDRLIDGFLIGQVSSLQPPLLRISPAHILMHSQ